MFDSHTHPLQQVQETGAKQVWHFDAVGVTFERALQPRVFVISEWYLAHPSIEPIRRMLMTMRVERGGEQFRALVTDNLVRR